MTDQSPTTEYPRRPKRLLRSRDNRMIGGVAGGLGEYFNVDPIVFRIAFPVLTFVGGAGLIAYIIALAFVPQDDGTGQPRPGSYGVRRVAVILGWGALAVAALVGAGALFAASAWASAAGGGIGIAIAVIVLGVLLAIGASRGAGKRTLLPLAIAGALLALPAAVVAAAGIEIDGSVGNREFRPTSDASIPAKGYKQGVGRLLVDLRDVSWRANETRDVRIKLGVGAAIVVVPRNVCVESSARVGAGAIDILSDNQDGWDLDAPVVPGPSSAPRLRLHGDVGAGALEVVHEIDGSYVDDQPDNAEACKAR